MAPGPQEAAAGIRSDRAPQDRAGARSPAPRLARSHGMRPAVVLKPTDHDLTIVVPAFNEEQRLPATLRGLAEYLDAWGIDYRVLVVDDGSSDRTANLSTTCGRRLSTISQRNRGKGAAVRNGVLHATGRIVAFTDADLPYDLTALQQACRLIEQGNCDVVFGARDLRESTVRAPRRLMRTIAHRAFSAIVRQLISREVTDTQCGLKVFRRQAAVEVFARSTIDGFAFDAEIVFLTHRLQLPFRRVPVSLINEYASTISLSRHAFPMLLDVLRVRRRAWRGRYLPVGALAIEIAPDPARDPLRTAA